MHDLMYSAFYFMALILNAIVSEPSHTSATIREMPSNLVPVAKYIKKVENENFTDYAMRNHSSCRFRPNLPFALKSCINNS